MSSPTQQAAADKVGVSDTTARRWLSDPLVKARYETMKQEFFDESLALLLKFTKSAIQTLASIMVDKEIGAGTRVAAARTLLEQAVNIHKLNQLEQRIAELEAEDQ